MMNFLTAITLTLLVTVYCQEPVKICVSEQLQESCRQMEQEIPDKFTCVIGRDWVDCAQKMQKKEADVTNMDIRAVYMAGKFFGGAPLAAEVSEGSSIYYNGVALVEKGSDIKTPEDLRGKRACHTAYGRTAWQLSLARLMSIGVLQPQSCKEGSQGSMEFLKLVDDFFSGGSCASGNRSFDPLVDQEIKNRFPGLCSRCKDPESCSWEDEYLGYQGVIHCLLDDSGDVSFTSIKAVKEFLKKDSSLAEKVDLLCPEGGTAELTPDGEGLQSCFWGFRASNAFMSTQETIQEKGERVLSAILETQALYKPVQIHIPDWYHKSFLSSSFVDGVEPVDPNRNDYRSYLGDDYVYSIEGPQCQSLESNVMNWCVISEHEKSKCEDYAKAAVSRGLWPEIGCVLATSKAACMELIKNEHANLVTLDGGDVYKAGRYFDLLPVSAEMYGDLDASYFSVAVIRSASDVSKLSELRGLRSCHTGMGRTAGWVVPLGSLIRDGSIEADQCDRAAAVAGFFEAGSCVPGANDTKYNPGRSNADKLCQQCIGDNEGRFKCSRDSKERYSGYAGAFRCLSEGRGDVAFVKHTTAKEYTDGRSSDDWARDLLSSDFQLLCGRGGNAPIQEYSRCNLAKVPSHYVMTNSDATADDRLKIAKFLASSSEYFYDKYTSLFRIFGSYGSGIGQKDLIFKDSTTSLKAIPFTSSYIDAIGEDFYTASEAVDPKACQNTS